MILPLITDDIPQDGFVDRSAAYVDCQVFVFVAGFQQLSNRIDWVSVKFLDAWGWEGHGYNPGGNVCQIEVESIFFISVFGTTHKFP